jgi:hypothetical protein
MGPIPQPSASPMLASIFNLNTKDPTNWKEGEYPASPQVSVRIMTFHQDNNGIITIGPWLMTEKEVDYTIDNFIQELEKARKKAKLELKNTLKKQLKK